MPPRAKKTSKAGSDRARGWLELIQTQGPFLTAPVVARAWPQGMPAVPYGDRARLRLAVEGMRADHGRSAGEVITAVLAEVLDWQGDLRSQEAIPDAFGTAVLDNGQVVTADLAFRAPEDGDEPADDLELDAELEADGDDDAAPVAPPTKAVTEPWRLLGLTWPYGTHPLVRTTIGGATASPVERCAALLRARDVPIGLVTDGRWWAIVWAPRGKTTGAAVWDADLWSVEPETLEAFVALLTRSRFLAVADGDTLPALLAESSNAAEEVTDTLGAQVRASVELLISTLDRLDAESSGRLLAEVSDDDVYAAAVTVMMRIVFLLFAEERRLLPADDDRYDASYSVGRLVEQLRARAATFGEQTLEHRTGAWHRLLALSRAVHGGIHHEELRLPAYGSELFDAARFSWLSGSDTTEPPAIDDRTVLNVLDSVQFVRIDQERRRLTFRALDVEQIGYVYEGLLELEVRTASEPLLALSAKGVGKSKRAQGHVSVTAALQLCADSESLSHWAVTSWLGEKDNAKRRADVAKRLARDVAGVTLAGIAQVLGPDATAGLVPVAAIIETDEHDAPVIVREGGRYVGSSSRRAATGTHYTPRSLAEEIVRHTLEPLVYRPGPLETLDAATWRLRPSSEITSLKVADIAMGSGAFLVAACRWLADRVVEAWSLEGDAEAARATDEALVVTADAEVSRVVLRARRLVAEHCLYGVDINPLAVQMAKLSLWLVTMDRERPFGFLDDRLVCGDSLLGIRSVDQLEALHIDPVAGRKRRGETLDFSPTRRNLLAEAADTRRRITALPVTKIGDVETKLAMLLEARRLTVDLEAEADALTGAGLVAAGLTAAKADLVFANLDLIVEYDGWAHDRGAHWRTHELQRGNPPGKEPRRPLHWPLAFPEVFADTENPGFDAIVGNPPFLGGKKLSGTFGNDYLAWLQTWDGSRVKGECDLGGRFVLRADRLVSSRGQVGFVATNTLIEGTTLSVSLLALDKQQDWHLRRAISPHPWPSRSANLQVIELWTSKQAARTPVLLDGEVVPNVTVDLQPYLRTTGRPERLLENADSAFQGSNVLGLGFTLTPEEAANFIREDPRNAAVLAPYVIGQDLNRRPDCSASRWIINFHDWDLEQAAQYPAPLARLERLVKPERDRLPDYKKRVREHWWRYEHIGPALYRAIEKLDRVLVMAQVSNVALPVLVPNKQVFSHKTVVFAMGEFAELSLFSSSVHSCWLIRYTGSMRTDISYSPSVVVASMPRPVTTESLKRLGQSLDCERRELMLGRGWGLTKTYNAVHDPSVSDPEIVRLRDIHTQIDYAVLEAYGWADLDPQIGHHPTKIGLRWTVSQDARFELLDRLLEENHRRFALQSG